MVALYSGGKAASQRLEELRREKIALAKKLQEIVAEEAEINLHVLVNPSLGDAGTTHVKWALQVASGRIHD